MSDPTGNFRTIDLAAKKSEEDWGRAFQAGTERAADTWFTWIGWVFATGALGILATKTGSFAVKALELISLSVIYFYFLQFFGSIRIEPITSRLVRSGTKRAKALLIVLVIVVSALPAIGVRFLTIHVTELLGVVGPVD